MQKLVIATRSSPLALWQANDVASRLNRFGIETELRAVETLGDRRLEVTLSRIGDKGVFTQELEQMLVRGEAHLAVHSAKDMPSNLPNGLQIVAFTEREEPMDVLVSFKEKVSLEDALVVGTSSTRRTAVLNRYYPHIQTVSVRGNLQTRIRKMEEGQCDALLLAFAGIHRMGFGNLIRQKLPLSIFTPAVGQGSLAIEISEELDLSLQKALKQALNHPETGIALEAERSFLRTMDGGCSVPVFGYGHFFDGQLLIEGGIISLDGSQEVRQISCSPLHVNDPARAAELGRILAEEILNQGGDSILSKIKQNLQPQ